MNNSHIKKIWNEVKPLVMYTLVGCVTVPISWSIFTFTVMIHENTSALSRDEAYLIGNLIGWIVATTLSFFATKRFVFHDEDWTTHTFTHEIILFFAVRAFSAAFEITAQPFLASKPPFDYELFGVPGLIAKMMVTAVAIAINFIYSKKLIFRPRARKRNPELNVANRT